MSLRKPPAIRVLLADADQTFRMLRAQIFALEDDLEVVAAVASGAAILELAQLHAPHIAVLAPPLPGCDELTLTRELRAQVPDCEVVILGTPEGMSLEDALSAGAKAVLLKDAMGGELIQAIHAVHGGRRYVDQDSVANAVTRLTRPRD